VLLQTAFRPRNSTVPPLSFSPTGVSFTSINSCVDAFLLLPVRPGRGPLCVEFGAPLCRRLRCRLTVAVTLPTVVIPEAGSMTPPEPRSVQLKGPFLNLQQGARWSTITAGYRCGCPSCSGYVMRAQQTRGSDD
jgi:hypothetical protein